MVKHIVMFRLEGEKETVAEAARKFKAGLDELPGIIKELKSIEVGLNDGPASGNWTVVLTAVCDSYEDLSTYSAHPAHVACVSIIKPLIGQRACVDYCE